MNKIVLLQPPGIVFGAGVVKEIPEDKLVQSSVKILMVVALPVVGNIAEIAQRIRSYGKEVEVIIYQFPGEPTFSQFDELLVQAIAFNPDLVIGVGGGSVLDSAKLLAAFTLNEQVYTEAVGVGLLKQRVKKLICVPTTSGTGSEVSPVAILLNEKTEAKSGIVSEVLIPDVSYIDPELTYSLPPKFTAETGIDALCHCIEAYTNKFAHPLVDIYAIEGIRLVSANLLRAFQFGEDAEARAAMSKASMYGGLCLGPVNTHAVHCLSYGLGGKYHISHGLANAVLLPAVLRFNMDAAPERHAEIALTMGVQPQDSAENTALEGINKIENLLQGCGIPRRLSELGIEADDIESLADIALGVTRLLKNNPKPITRNDIINIYKSIL
jgi:alcohol dehydrogenase class IV